MIFAKEAFERCGSAQRSNRNMIVFLAPDSKRLAELEESTRSYLAWSWVDGRKVELDLSPQQVTQVDSNVARNDEDIAVRIAQTYHWALVPEQPNPAAPAVISVEKAEGAKTQLAERVTEKLTRSGLLTASVAARAIRLDLDQRLRSVWERGHISVGELWGYYCKYPYLTRLRNRSVLVDGVLSVLSSLTWELEGFALADSYDQAIGRYGGLVLPDGDAHFGQITDATLLVAPPVAIAQVEADMVDAPSAEDETVATPRTSKGRAPEESDQGTHSVRNTRFFGVYQVDPERYARDLTRVSQEILQQLAAVDGASLQVTVEVHAHAPEGFPEDKVRVVSENARTLNLSARSGWACQTKCVSRGPDRVAGR